MFALAMQIFAGVFNGNIAVARAYIGDVSTPKQLATRMGLIGAAFGLGFTIGPFLGGEFSTQPNVGMCSWERSLTLTLPPSAVLDCQRVVGGFVGAGLLQTP